MFVRTLFLSAAAALALPGASAAADTVFACSFGDRSVEITAEGNVLSYQFGPPGAPDLTLTRDASSTDLSHHYALFTHASERWLRFRNGDYSYIAYTLFSTPDYEGKGAYDVSGLLVLEGDEEIARLDCDTPEQFGGGFDLSMLEEDGDVSADLIYQAVVENDETITEFGLITAAEDAPYPIFIVSVDFPERQFSEDFILNVEAVPLDLSDLMQLVGHYASFDYTSKLENALIDIESDGVMLLGTDRAEISPDWNTVTGTLAGANEITGSDLPGEVFIEDPDGTVTVFPYFVPSEFIPSNGKVVTAYFVATTRNEIVRIEPAAN